MKIIIISVLFVMSVSYLFAQNISDTISVRPMNNINLNILGDASIVSLNYERLFFITPGIFISGDLGIGFNQEFTQNLDGSGASTPDTYLTIPHHITGNIGKGKHFFEFGMGGTIINGFPDKKYFLYPIIGYRLQPLKSNKVNFRIFTTLLNNGKDSEIYILPLGLSLGLCF